MSDILILIAIYAVSAAMAITGLFFLLKQREPKPKKQAGKKSQVVRATEDMLPGWGKEEEEAKQ